MYSFLFLPSHCKVLRLMLCILLGMLCTSGYAQKEKRFILYDSHDGLSNNNVHSITRTADGLVWLGTQDGLCSFDGNQFKLYKHNESDSNSISDQFVLFIEEDKKNNLWIGTRSGLNYFNRKSRRFKRFYMDEKEKHVFQSSYDYFLVQQDNKLILKNEGLILLDAAANTKKILQPGNSKVIDWLVMPDYSGWSFNSDHKVYYFKDTRKKENVVAGKHSIPVASKIVFRQLVINDSIIVLHNLYALDSIYFFNKKNHSIYKKTAVPKRSVDIIRNGNNLLLCNANGLFEKNIFSNEDWLPVRSTPFNGLPSSGFLTAYPDKENNLWLGTAGAGLVVNNPNFELFTTVPTSIPNERINAVAVSQNTLYAGTYSGVYRIKNLAAATALQFEPFFPGKFISAITTDQQNNIWAAELQAGIFVLSPSGKIIRTVALPEPQVKKTILNLASDETGRILISTSNGFFVAGPGNGMAIRRVDTPGSQKLINHYVMSSFLDNRKQVWLAGYHGIDVLNEKLLPQRSFKSFRDDESFLQRSIITSITQDKEDAMWIATIRNGVYRYAGGQYTHYTNADGLSSDIAYNIICDNNNRIWVCTSAGLNVFDVKEKTFRSIPAFDGISKIAFSLGPVARYNNKLIFGASGKLLIADAGKYIIKEEKLDAFISDVKINGQSIDIPGNQLATMPDNKLIQFEFAYTPGFHSGNIIYQYRMQGIDSNWITLTPGASSISYTGLPYKKLEMQVRAAGAVNALKNAKVFSLFIKASPPFFKTVWFIILAAIVLMACGFIVWSLYNKRKFRQQLQALKMEKELHKERSRIGRDLHGNIGAYTSALIAGLNRIKPADELQHRSITDLKDYGSSIMGLLRETIWMLNAEELTVTAFADRFINYAMRINKNYPEIDFSFEEKISTDKKLQPAIMLHLFRILQEALQNACKHSEAGKIIIAIHSNETLEFMITDNGKGFDGNAARDHYGIDNMKDRAADAG
ncbi:MAG: hypothetical protein EOO03_01655, partial [Chitinophagaceae bacterium]